MYVKINLYRFLEEGEKRLALMKSYNQFLYEMLEVPDKLR